MTPRLKVRKKNQFLPVSGSVFVCSSFDYRHEREVVAVRDAEDGDAGEQVHEGGFALPRLAEDGDGVEDNV